jgi:hypothetical protein
MAVLATLKLCPPTEDEMLWFLRNLAMGLVSHLGACEPPVPVERLVANPPPALSELSALCLEIDDPRDELHDGRILNQRADLSHLSNLQRVALGRKIYETLVASELGPALGLCSLLERGEELRRKAETRREQWSGLLSIQPARYGIDSPDYAAYFARVLLAPDPMIILYRQLGGEFSNFASAFRIPDHTAFIRWFDPLFARNGQPMALS